MTIKEQKSMARKCAILILEHNCWDCNIEAHAAQLFYIHQELYPCNKQPSDLIYVPMVEMESDISDQIPNQNPLLWVEGWILWFRGWVYDKLHYVYLNWYLDDRISGLDDWELLYLSHHDLWEAKPLFLEWTLCHALKQFPAKHPRILEIIGNYAISLTGSKNQNNSMAWNVWLTAARTQVLGSEHPATAGALIGLGVISRKWDACQESLSFMVQACERRIRALGYDDILTHNAIGFFAEEANGCNANGEGVNWFSAFVNKNGAEKSLRYIQNRPHLVAKVIPQLLRNGRLEDVITLLPNIPLQYYYIQDIFDAFLNRLYRAESVREREDIMLGLTALEKKRVASHCWWRGFIDETEIEQCRRRNLGLTLGMACAHNLLGDQEEAESWLLRGFADQRIRPSWATWGQLADAACCPTTEEPKETRRVKMGDATFTWRDLAGPVTFDVMLDFDRVLQEWRTTYVTTAWAWAGGSWDGHWAVLATDFYNSKLCLGPQHKDMLESLLVLMGRFPTGPIPWQQYL
ncbi:hypothetical protein QQZ08_008477 [Neonectria magnoliae]|uniref:Uncharacterized protein n=1 Tax=Neonectria magnoliae TaxID=2732573 RepID=A0ABR1HVJ4_9HYPO